jgi:PAT family beta-lactamase induction signal transducer AmpG
LLNNLDVQHSWQESLKAALNRQVVIMLFLGFSAGLPILLIFSSLSLWLREAGVDRAVVTYFSWAALGYSFKFVWAPLVDRLPIPFLTKILGQRRSWLLLAQLSIVLAMTIMALTNPASADTQLTLMAIGAVLLGFSSASQDIVIDAYRIEAADPQIQGMMSASYIAGYRIGMIVAGAGALYLADFWGSTREAYNYEAWKNTYHVMSLFMLVGITTTLVIHEPILNRLVDKFSTNDYLRLVAVFIMAVFVFITGFVMSADLSTQLKQNLGVFLGNDNLGSFMIEIIRLVLSSVLAYMVAKVAIKVRVASRELIELSYIAPIKSFFESYGAKTAWLLLALIGMYRISDIVLGVISNVFYQDMGFSKTEIAYAVKVFGLVMAIVGGFAGGIFTMRFGVMRMLFLGAVLVVATNLLFIVLVHSGHNLELLYLVVAADNFVAGLASAAFIAFLSGLVDVRFTAMQYAIFSSLMTLLPKAIGGYSGSIVDSVGYTNFFLIASCLGLPVLLLVYLANQSLTISQKTEN